MSATCHNKHPFLIGLGINQCRLALAEYLCLKLGLTSVCRLNSDPLQYYSFWGLAERAATIQGEFFFFFFFTFLITVNFQYYHWGIRRRSTWQILRIPPSPEESLDFLDLLLESLAA